MYKKVLGVTFSTIPSTSDPFQGWQKMCIQFKNANAVTQFAIKLTRTSGFSVAVRSTDDNSAADINSKTWENIKK